MNAISSFVLGQQTGDTVIDHEGEPWFANGGARRAYKWTANDPSGICRYTIDERYIEGWTYEVVDTPTNSTSGQYTFYTDGYESSADLFEIRVNAYDCAGNVTNVLRPGDDVQVERDHGPTVPSGWARTSCTCAIGDSMLRTWTRNASLSTVVNGGGTNKHVALIMAKGAPREVRRRSTSTAPTSRPWTPTPPSTPTAS